MSLYDVGCTATWKNNNVFNSEQLKGFRPFLSFIQDFHLGETLKQTLRALLLPYLLVLGMLEARWASGYAVL